MQQYLTARCTRPDLVVQNGKFSQGMDLRTCFFLQKMHSNMHLVVGCPSDDSLYIRTWQDCNLVARIYILNLVP